MVWKFNLVEVIRHHPIRRAVKYARGCSIRGLTAPGLQRSSRDGVHKINPQATNIQIICIYSAWNSMSDSRPGLDTWQQQSALWPLIERKREHFKLEMLQKYKSCWRKNPMSENSNLIGSSWTIRSPLYTENPEFTSLQNQKCMGHLPMNLKFEKLQEHTQDSVRLRERYRASTKEGGWNHTSFRWQKNKWKI